MKRAFYFVGLSLLLPMSAGCGDQTSTLVSGTDAGPTASLDGAAGAAFQDAGGLGGPSELTTQPDGTRSCSGIGDLLPLAADPDTGFVDVSEFCLAEINRYRALAGLEPYTLHTAGICCSAQEAWQAVLDGTSHNGDYCDWSAQGACGGGRGTDGTVEASVAWCPRLFYEEGPDGGHYQGMMQVEPRGVACGYYAQDRDEHRILVNYW